MDLGIDPATEQEAVVITGGIGAALALAVTFGVHLDDAKLDAIKTAAAQLVPLALLIWARHRVANSAPAQLVRKALAPARPPSAG